MLPVVLTQFLDDVTLVVRVHYQACNDTACYPPAALSLPLPLGGLDRVRD